MDGESPSVPQNAGSRATVDHVLEATRAVTILNEQGLHARPIMQFVDLANRFESTITLAKGDQVVDGKSPMEIMLLEATFQTNLVLSAIGVDARQAVDALAELINGRFAE